MCPRCLESRGTSSKIQSVKILPAGISAARQTFAPPTARKKNGLAIGVQDYDPATEAPTLSSELVTLQIVLMLELEVTMIAAAATATKARMITYSTMS